MRPATPAVPLPLPTLTPEAEVSGTLYRCPPPGGIEWSSVVEVALRGAVRGAESGAPNAVAAAAAGFL